METKFQHFILTRFNLEFSTWNSDKKNNTIRDEAWLKHRFELFDKICFPSIQNQTNQNFKWLVFFDINTPEKYKKKINIYGSKFSNFLPVFISGRNNHKVKIKQEIIKIISPNCNYIITTRIDNDDAFHKDAINIIQSKFNSNDNTLIDLISGICLQLEPKLMISKINSHLNPFISLIEKTDDIETVFLNRHNQWDKNLFNIIKIKDKALWLQTIHSRNMLNNFRFEHYLMNKSILKSYNINENISQLGILFLIKTIWYNIKNIDIYLKKIIKRIIKY